jgi:ribosomal protein S20
MALNPVSTNVENKNVQPTLKGKSTPFTGGGGNPVVAIMDSVGRGGYITEFIAQDFCGFIAPRVTTGLNRNRDETGEYNWKFAATEAIRELLSGPSMIAIPFVMLWFAKKQFGSANDVPIKFIKSIGDDFAEFMSKQKGAKFTDTNVLKNNYYKATMKNVLNNATEGHLSKKELDNLTKKFTDKILEAEKAPKKGGLDKFIGKKTQGTAEDILTELHEDFVTLRKKHSGSLGEVLNVSFTTKNQGVKISTETRLETFLKHLKNYTEDAANTVVKSKVDKSKVAEFIHGFNNKRISSRFKLNLCMDLAVAAFLSIVPKLYKHKDGNPGLAGLGLNEHCEDKDPSNENMEGE